MDGGSTPGDLNRGAGGDDIFLHFKTEYVPWGEHRAGSFSHVDGNTIYIESEGELAKLARDVNGGNNYLGKTVVLNRDLDLSEYAWDPIGDRYWYDNHLGYIDDSRWVVLPRLPVKKVYPSDRQKKSARLPVKKSLPV